ncbi:STAS domain-containing protein [Streptomyces johnsoniae]|uniref:STAS domain-containing protein n=1 Tax=Streptomyces johnsoniae TaxID=3075532 RepID=A0ABU2S6S5_9ACTN|nr:STAS domain-containing protein [Streptomyces sp. DSM 41886]MDT0443340.1 STAS domain-containing protein [Streptomyces sp. DSM 41886]
MRTEVFVVWGPVLRADVPGLCERLAAFVRDSGAREVIVDVGAVREADPVALEVVARVRLTASRLGCRVRLVNVGGGLQALLRWLGLGEAVGQAEEGEEARRVEEGVDPGDPAV